MRTATAAALCCLAVCPAGCFAMRSSDGGGQTGFAPPRHVNPDDVALPDGYRIEAVVEGLTFPTGMTFDEDGRVCVVEAGYSYGEAWTSPRLLRIEQDGAVQVIASGENPPWNGVDFSDGAFYVAEGGQLNGGRIIRIDMNGSVTPLVEDLPGLGDHHTNGPLISDDRHIYFAQGTATNSGVVGVDNWDFGWLGRHPEFHDIPGGDITLTGANFTTDNPLTDERGDKATTGAYLPFGTPSTPGQVIRGRVPCSGAVMRIPLDGGEIELVAWGLRNPFGMAFAPDGSLYVTENSYDVRGSRPVFGTGDLLWRIDRGTWYGWPDFHGFHPIAEDEHYKAPGEPQLRRLVADHPAAPPAPTAVLGVHSSATGIDFSRSRSFGHVGQALVALFGDMASASGKVLAPVGFKVVRVDTTTGVVEDFAVNRGDENGPASKVGGGGLERPIDVAFSPDGEALYIVDFGVMTMGDAPQPRANTGVIWRVTRQVKDVPP